MTRLIEVISNGDVKEVLRLIDAGANVNTVSWFLGESSTPLRQATQRGHVEIVWVLLAHQNIDVNLANENGDTPLHKACVRGYIKIVELLINSNADLSKVNNQGKRPLGSAIINDHMEVRI